MVTKQKKLNEFDDKIKALKIRVYLAGGWFDKYQIKAISYLENFLSSFNEFEVFSPRKNIVLKPNISKKEQDKVFKENLKQINEADIVIVSTVGKDITTLFEAGYAFAKNKKIIYTFFDERFNDITFNLMLAKSGIICYTNNEKKDFESDIQSIVQYGIEILKNFKKYGSKRNL